MDKSNKFNLPPAIEDSPSMSFPSGEKGASVVEKDIVVEIRSPKPGSHQFI